VYNQQQTGFTGTSAIAGAPVQSQYRGFQQQYQPVGTVQSQYDQNQSWQQQQQQQQQQGAASFHAANYRGNQPNHDQYLRSDSPNPSQMGMSGFVQSQYQPQSQYQGQAFGSAQSFHAANYRGNQPNHDQYLRSDSPNPSQFGSIGFVQSQYQPQNQYQQQQNQYQQQSQYQPQSQYQGQAFGSIQSFHAANYRGNQPNHDQYLRADATRPSSSFSSRF
jgi:hypothetical protein